MTAPLVVCALLFVVGLLALLWALRDDSPRSRRDKPAEPPDDALGKGD